MVKWPIGPGPGDPSRAYGNDKTTSEARDLVPGSLRVYRAWGFGERDYRDDYRDPDADLTAVARSWIWGPGVNTAGCVNPVGSTFQTKATSSGGLRSGTVNLWPRTTVDHPTPDLHCSCGFYAQYRWDDGVEYMGSASVVGACQASGTVVLGTRGVRAQHMRIEALMVGPNGVRVPGTRNTVGKWPNGCPAPSWSPPSSRKLSLREVQRQLAHYEVPIYAWGDPEFLDRFPPDDVSALVPESTRRVVAVRAVNGDGRDWALHYDDGSQEVMARVRNFNLETSPGGFRRITIIDELGFLHIFTNVVVESPPPPEPTPTQTAPYSWGPPISGTAMGVYVQQHPGGPWTVR
jgi:hypothetical protein